MAVLLSNLAARPVGLAKYLLSCLSLNLVMALVASTYIALAPASGPL
ncbi:MAG: hypothetical protein M4D85_03885 [Actinomycetota bacterium]|nr:hypothetical protein [Actinomycetota bacterium]